MAISNKQLQILAFPFTDYDALICDGAIRSGKTSFMTVAFIDDAMRRYNHQTFGICGKTVDATVKNIIVPYMALSYVKQKYQVSWKRGEKVLFVRCGDIENRFEVFGGKDEASFKLIQGRTLAGVMLDEVALLPRSFVEQALARCSVDGSRFWFNCNPDSPDHWFYTDWIKGADGKNALHLHFLLEDNPALSKKKIEQYHGLYKGVFFRRYILGEWCVAKGLIYDFGEGNITDEKPDGAEYYISIDYGTLNPFSAGLWSVTGAKAVRIDEYYYSGRAEQHQLTDEEYCDAVKSLAADHEIRSVIVDPSAASFITALKRRGFKVRGADNAVLDGIRKTAVMLSDGTIKIHRSCINSIREFGLYRWDDTATEDTVIKDNDHAMDDIRYFCATVMSQKVRKKDYVSVLGLGV